ncbi:MAG: SRPBCC domain-containing protein [Paracoccaceae bacterium]
MATLTMQRVFDAQPAKVFEFLTQTENLLNWWGPEGMKIHNHSLDFSKVGPWFAVMVGPEGGAAKVGGQVLEVNAPHAIELTLNFVMEDGHGPESTIRFEVSASDTGGTHLLLTQTGLDPEHIEDMMKKGWNAALLRLEILVTKTN